MNKSSIEWTDFSWSPITGCTKRCTYCFANSLANSRLRKLYLSNPNVAPGCNPNDPFSPRFWCNRLEGPCTKRNPSKIFVCSMGELFDPSVPHDWIKAVLVVASFHQRHTFQFLTRQPQRAANFAFPPNAWVGVTINDSSPESKARQSRLVNVRASVRFYSYEPLLGLIDHVPIWTDWIIIGALTGPKRKLLELNALYSRLDFTYHNNQWTLQPPSSWVQTLIDHADAASVPVFIKDNLDWPHPRREWPKGTQP